MSEDAQDIRAYFVRTGVQYLAAGRYAALEQVLPISGTLLHHALEMLIKALLSRTVTLAELKRMSHRLPDLWSRAISLNRAIDRPEFRTTLSSLHRFEDLRYPDTTVSRGASISYSNEREDFAQVSPRGLATPEYSLVLEEVDDLVHALFAAMGLSPSNFVDGMSLDAEGQLWRHNKHAGKYDQGAAQQTHTARREA